MPRRKSYTERGLKTVTCCACQEAPAREQFNVSMCAAPKDRGWVPLCAECDAEMNEIVLRFLRVPRWRALMSAYRAAKGLARRRRKRV